MQRERQQTIKSEVCPEVWRIEKPFIDDYASDSTRDLARFRRRGGETTA